MPVSDTLTSELKNHITSLTLLKGGTKKSGKIYTYFLVKYFLICFLEATFYWAKSNIVYVKFIYLFIYFFQSYSISEHFTPTVSDEFCPPHYQHSSSHSRNHDDDSRHAAFRRDRMFDRIRIPSTTSVNTKSGSLEIGMWCCIIVMVTFNGKPLNSSTMYIRFPLIKPHFNQAQL